jgi:hypothetical protein
VRNETIEHEVWVNVPIYSLISIKRRGLADALHMDCSLFSQIPLVHCLELGSLRIVL